MRLEILPRLFLLLCAARLACAAQPAAKSREGIEFFESRIRPMLVERCYECHSAQSKKLRGGLRLDSQAGMLKGGDTGPALVPGNPEKSLFIKAIRYVDDELLMPPKKKLSPQQVADFEAWVRMGAPDPRTESVAKPESGMDVAKARAYWSFQPPKEPPIPKVKEKKWAQSPVDYFILAKLEEKKLKPSPPADKRALLRRASFDLTGLPPTAEEIAAFESDSSPDAFAKVVDRLLASPHYGERWGRYWLDVARYADTKGYVFEEERRYAYSYTYRDWVIRALNDDLPYDQFLVQQIAADRLPLGDDKRPLAALGFLTLGRRFLNQQPDIIDDRIDVICRGTMGLTVACARCHDHKYDPIPTKDYYSLYGVFASSTEPKDLPLIAHGEKTQANLDYEKELAARKKEVQEYKEKRFKEHIDKANKPEMRDKLIAYAQETLNTSGREARKAAEAKKLDAFGAAYYRSQLKAKKDPAALKAQPIAMSFDQAVALLGNEDELLDGEDQRKIREIQKKVDAVSATHAGAPARAMAMQDLPAPVNPRVFVRGNAGNPGDEVPRQFLEILAPNRQPFKNGSGRLELAQTIASPANPLTARVMVNRVWLLHFGAGLVRTPSDFGTRADPPSHPELLDYLACRFVADGWSLKKLHRLLMLSSVYQQSSEDNAKSRAVDADNTLLWRMRRKRLDFEALRDSVLFAAGQLDTSMGGRGVELTTQPFTRRRTVYGFVERQNLPSMFRTFDFASPDTHSPQRYFTTVPQQALFMMNSPFVVEQARQLATRSETAKDSDPARRIQKLYALAYGRAATADEIKLGLAFVNADGSDVAEPPAARAAAWQYGYGAYSQTTKRVASFKPLPHFTGSAWQAGPQIPDPKLGWVLLTGASGHPGNDDAHAAIRRWTAPRDGTINITGKLGHVHREGNGVLGRIVSSQSGELGTWTAHNSEAATNVQRVTVKSGETLDFVVEPRGEFGYDSFGWAPVIQLLGYPEPPPADEITQWAAAADFRGPAGKKASRLSPWEKYAQVLLESNEFVFVD